MEDNEEEDSEEGATTARVNIVLGRFLRTVLRVGNRTMSGGDAFEVLRLVVKVRVVSHEVRALMFVCLHYNLFTPPPLACIPHRHTRSSCTDGA